MIATRWGRRPGYPLGGCLFGLSGGGARPPQFPAAPSPPQRKSPSRCQPPICFPGDHPLSSGVRHHPGGPRLPPACLLAGVEEQGCELFRSRVENKITLTRTGECVLLLGGEQIFSSRNFTVFVNDR
jgi:hypothetical protein